MTAPATGTAPAAPGSTEPPVAPQAPIDTPVAVPATGTPNGDDALGEGGKKALDAERKARDAAEKALRAAESKVRAFEDAQKTEAEKTAERIRALEEDAAKALRYEAADKAELPLSLAARLKGNTLEELIADAAELKQLLGATTPAAPTPPATPAPDRRQGGGQAEPGGTMAAGRADYEARKAKK